MEEEGKNEVVVQSSKEEVRGGKGRRGKGWRDGGREGRS